MSKHVRISQTMWPDLHYHLGRLPCGTRIAVRGRDAVDDAWDFGIAIIQPGGSIRFEWSGGDVETFRLDHVDYENLVHFRWDFSALPGYILCRNHYEQDHLQQQILSLRGGTRIPCFTRRHEDKIFEHRIATVNKPHLDFTGSDGSIERTRIDSLNLCLLVALQGVATGSGAHAESRALFLSGRSGARTHPLAPRIFLSHTGATTVTALLVRGIIEHESNIRVWSMEDIPTGAGAAGTPSFRALIEQNLKNCDAVVGIADKTCQTSHPEYGAPAEWKLGLKQNKHVFILYFEGELDEAKKNPDAHQVASECQWFPIPKGTGNESLKELISIVRDQIVFAMRPDVRHEA